MFPEKAFPLQQGALDSLCAVYSVLNCLNALGELDCHVEACKRFRTVMPEFEMPVDAVLDGFDPGTERGSDISWLGQVLSRRAHGKPELLHGPLRIASDRDLASLLDDSEAGGIIYFHDLQEADLTHYTFVKKRLADGVFPLWDSYGFSGLDLTPDGAFVDGQAVTVTHLWLAVREG